MVWVTLYALTFHMSLSMKYGAWFHIPCGADDENCGCVQLAEPVTGGGELEVDGDGELADGEAELADGVGWWLAGRLGVPDVRDAGFGMTATCGAAASAGIRVADELFAPSRPEVAPPEVEAAAAALGAGLCPPPMKLTAANPPAASTAAVAMPTIAPRDSGNGRAADLPGPRVSPALGLLMIWRTRSPIMAASGGL